MALYAGRPGTRARARAGRGASGPETTRSRAREPCPSPGDAAIDDPANRGPNGAGNPRRVASHAPRDHAWRGPDRLLGVGVVSAARASARRAAAGDAEPLSPPAGPARVIRPVPGHGRPSRTRRS